ncbi:MAG: hypothetical protein JW787_09955 [Sedimentisphaerales bacterium]|nr:hypothetical protein [Sedimentisphaerales bacterium]
MATAKHIIIIFALVLFSTQAAIPETQISNSRQASCYLQITTYSDSFKFNLMATVQSSGVKGKAVQDILGVSPDKVEVTVSNYNGEGKSGVMTYTCELIVALSPELSPQANGILKAIVENLKRSLKEAYKEYSDGFNTQYETAMKNYKEAESQLNKLNEEPVIKVIPNDNYTYGDYTNKQLEKVVNLSNLDPSISFEEVLNIMEKSVEPPLQIQPNWRDLADLPDIQPTTPAEMGPLPKVKLRTAIEILLAGLSTPDVPIGYLYHDGVITIATKDSIKIPMVTFVFDISGLLVNGRTSSSLIKAIKETIEPDSWYDENISAITSVPSERYAGYGGGYSGIPSRIKTGDGKIIDMQGGKISVYNTPEIQDKIISFLTTFPKEIPSEPVESIPAHILFEEQQKLRSQKRLLEMEVARLEAHQSAAERQILVLSDKMKNETSLDLLIKKRIVLSGQLEDLKKTRGEQHPEVVAVQKQIDEIQKLIASSQKDAITSELERLIASQTERLEYLKKEHEAQVAHGVASQTTPNVINEAEEKLTRTKIELAKRREELARPIGIENLAALNENLSMALLDLAEKKAQFQVIEKQLGEIDSQIKAATTIDPKIQKYRQARKAFEEAEKRLNEMKAIQTNMQPPQVIAIGLE